MPNFNLVNKLPVSRKASQMQILDISLFIWGGILVLILLVFMLFSTWQTMRNSGEDAEGLDLANYHRIEERKRKLAVAKAGQQKRLDLEVEDEDDIWKRSVVRRSPE
jgi:hypothetical protein